MGPILDLAQVAHIQPASDPVEKISDLILHIFVLMSIVIATKQKKCVEIHK